MPLDDFRPYPAYPDIYDRSRVSAPRNRLLFREGKFAQAAELNEAFSIADRKRTAIGDMVARAGDRRSGAEILVDQEEETVTLAAGEIYVGGDIRPVAAATLEDVPMVGDIVIGVRIVSVTVDHEDDVTLLGLHPGSAAEGEDGAIREQQTLTWGFSGDGGDGELLQVYLLRNGQPVDQTPPPNFSGFQAFLAPVTYGANGNYVEDGCVVTALGFSAGKQWFSIGEGVASILGYRRSRFTATRYGETEAPDLSAITAEPHTFDDSGSGTAVIRTNRKPINSVTTAIVTKQATETVVRGGVANTSDLLSHPSVTQIVSVVQGMTTFTPTTDYVRDGDRVSWAPGGAEPAGGSSYDVTYRYLAAVTPTAVDAETVTLSGGVTGETVLISYSYKLPRYDRVCLDRDGAVVYLKGVPASEQPRAPDTPATLLSLAIVKNDWFGTPPIQNDGVRAIPFSLQWAYFLRLVDLVDVVAHERLQSDIAMREPAARSGIFVDPFTSDRFRDAGEAQTGAVFDGSFQLPIDATFKEISLGSPQSLNYTEEAVVRQEFVTGCAKINEYQAFGRLPAVLKLTPAEDFWTESHEVWASPVTQVFGRGNASRVTSVRVNSSVVDVPARFLRQIEVQFQITGFGVGETLTKLSFDGIDVTPAGPLVGDANGSIIGDFTIPANVASGVKSVEATGGSGIHADAPFVGQGRIETTTRQRVTTVQRFREPVDPVAQSFMLTEGRHVSSIEVKFCAIGDRDEKVVLELVAVDNGYPTDNVLAHAETDMQAAAVGPFHKFAFPDLPFIAAGQEVAFVLKTNDPVHAVSIAARGGFDAAQQLAVGAQPYTVGVRFSSSNARAWTAHQDEDLTFRINCAKFSPTTKIVPLGIHAVASVSDIIVEAQSFLPTAAARVLFEVEPDGESPVRLEPGQVWERQSFFTGNVALRAILTGSDTVSPLLSRDVLLILGEIATSGTYVSRAFAPGEDITLNAVMRTILPISSTLTVAHDAADDDWHNLTAGVSTPLADGSFERTYSRTPVDEELVRLRLTLTGGPAARPAVSDLRAWSVPA